MTERLKDFWKNFLVRKCIYCRREFGIFSTVNWPKCPFCNHVIDTKRYVDAVSFKDPNVLRTFDEVKI